MPEKLYVTYNDVHKLCQTSAPRILNDIRPNLMIAIGGGGYVPARILRSFLKRPGAPNIPIQAIGLSLYESLPTTSRSHKAAPEGSAPETTAPETARRGARGSIGADGGIRGMGDRVDGGRTADGDESTAANGAVQQEPIPDPDVEKPGVEVTRTQWLDLSSLSTTTLIGKNILIVDEVDDTRTTLEYAVRELEKDVEAMRKSLGKAADDPEARTTFGIFVLHNKRKGKRGVLPGEMFEEGRYLAGVETGDVWICYPWEAGDIEEHDRLAAEGARG